MADYLLRFIGTLVEGTRPSGFPSLVYNDCVVRAENAEGLKNATNNEFRRILQTGGMVVPIDPTKIQTDDYDADGVIFIPMHMFAYIRTKTTKTVQEFEENAKIVN